MSKEKECPFCHRFVTPKVTGRGGETVCPKCNTCLTSLYIRNKFANKQIDCIGGKVSPDLVLNKKITGFKRCIG